ncbi:MAG: HAD family hydrolase [Chloroflexi bacterium]|nr:HAD family hydrolase [Chloroflexota bacterium]
MKLRPPYHAFSAWLIDMDGVIYRGAEPLPAAAEFIRILQSEQIPFLFLTNNAIRTHAQYVTRLAEMDIHVGEDAIFTSPDAAKAYLLAHHPPPARALVVGGDGIHQAVAQAGYEETARAEEADIVVVGLAFDITYAQLAEAALAIRRGCPWIATNPDRTLPSERGQLPGAGAVLAFLEAATDRKPIIVGKPETPIFEQALAKLGAKAEDAIMVGDRLETDILGGHRAGLRTLCVLTGAATRDQAENYTPRPDFIIEDLRDLIR